MKLSRRPPIYELPSYSLTSDLLGFMRCGLQYRYERIGQLPPSRPVQLWYGHFVHGVMEEAYRLVKAGERPSPPWPAADLALVLDRIDSRLKARRILPGSRDTQLLGRQRASAAVNELGPLLFPIITRAEVRLTGARWLQKALMPPECRDFRAANRYEVAGVVDVISHVLLKDPSTRENLLVRLILEQMAQRPAGPFEVILDYKGMRRPPSRSGLPDYRDLWTSYAWQVRTYAHLRNAHPDSTGVAAAAIVYLNELVPSGEDIKDLEDEIQRSTTDTPASKEALAALKGWRRPDREDSVSVPVDLEFRLRRAMRVVNVDPAAIDSALSEFDKVVAEIETCRAREQRDGAVMDVWPAHRDDKTCVRCDARTFCRAYTAEDLPSLPG